MEVFSSQIQLFPRTPTKLIEMLNDMPVSGTAIMVVLDASPIDETSKVKGTIQLTFNEVKVTFHVVAPSMAHISNFSSLFNMCSAHYCEIKFHLKEKESLLRIEFTPSNGYEAVIRNFTELLRDDPRWPLILISYPLDRKSKKKYFA